jgi:hypothetical protein
MSFWYKDHEVIWHGVEIAITSPMLQAYEVDDLMPTVLQEFALVF